MCIDHEEKNLANLLLGELVDETGVDIKPRGTPSWGSKRKGKDSALLHSCYTVYSAVKYDILAIYMKYQILGRCAVMSRWPIPMICDGVET